MGHSSPIHGTETLYAMTRHRDTFAPSPQAFRIQSSPQSPLQNIPRQMASPFSVWQVGRRYDGEVEDASPIKTSVPLDARMSHVPLPLSPFLSTLVLLCSPPRAVADACCEIRRGGDA